MDAGRGNPALAQFFTPRPVAAFVWQATRLYAGGQLGGDSRVIDPAAGRGVFLEVIASEGLVPPGQVYGVEIDPALTGCRLAGTAGTCFFSGDGLLDAFPGVGPGNFGAVVGNPPFGRLGDILPQAVARKEWERFTLREAGPPGRGKTAGAGIGGRCLLELLFLERALELVEPGGMVALVLPEGFFANARLQWARDWVRTRAWVRGVVALPGGVFRRTGLNARTGVVFLERRGGSERIRKTLLVRPAPEDRPDLETYLEEILQAIRRQLEERRLGRIDGLLLPEERLAERRWDAGYWQGRGKVRSLSRRFSLVRLGDFIQHLTYGPIITGSRPQPMGSGIRIIRQGDFVETGLGGEDVLRVAAGSAFDPLRSRVRPGDLLLPRSGVGALGRNRMAVYPHQEPANVGCFVDLVRLAGLNPFYAWFFFKSQPGWQQIQALINGVGTPNINFAEIRSLRLPAVPGHEQENLERRYFGEVWPLHCRRGESAELRREGERHFRRIVEDLEAFLAGRRRTLAACL